MNNLREVEELTSLIKSEGFRVYFRNILSEHRKNLIVKMEQSIKKHEDRKVGELYACVKEVEGIQALVKTRLNEVTKEEE